MIQKTSSSTPLEPIGYYPLPNGKVDVFMRKNEVVEQDEEGNTSYVADEISYQVDEDITKEFIETNFDLMWNKVLKGDLEPKLDDIVAGLKKRQEETENAILMLMELI